MGDELIHRLCAAVVAHDVDALVDCFAPGYRNETPAHPSRGFSGRRQVRANWQTMFDRIPDVSAEVLRTSVDGDEVWSEWEIRGTRPDGDPHLMRGVVIFGVGPEHIRWARFFLEPVDAGPGDVNAAVADLVSSRNPQ